MKQITVEKPTSANDNPNLSDLLQVAIASGGLIAIETEKLFDARPLSLVLASKLATGNPFGNFSIPKLKSVLYLDGELDASEVKEIYKQSNLPNITGTVHYSSFPSYNSNKEEENEDDVYLTDLYGRNLVNDEIQKVKCEAIIINNLLTVSNYFISGSEKDILSWIQQQQKETGFIVIAETGTKGLPILKQMANIVLSVTKADNSFDAPISVDCTKYPAYEIEIPQPICLSLSKEGNAWSVTQVNDPNQELNLIIELACYRTPQKEIGKIVGMKQYQISRILQKAEKQNLIVRNGSSVRRI